MKPAQVPRTQCFSPSGAKASEMSFTLVELLITVGILLVLTGALIPSFNTFIQTQHLKVSQEQIKDDIRNLVNKGFTYNNFDGSVQFGSGNPYYFYGLIIENNLTNSYKFYTSQVSGGCPPSDMIVVGKSTNLSSDVGIQISQVPYCISVNVLKPDTVISTAAPSPNICTGMPFCINIVPVNTSGVDGCYAVGFNQYGAVKTFHSACP